jgi:hypothetical protein
MKLLEKNWNKNVDTISEEKQHDLVINLIFSKTKIFPHTHRVDPIIQ